MLKRIGIVFEYSTLNGGEHSILAAIKKLHRVEFEFHAITAGDGPLLGALKKYSVPVSQIELRTSTSERIPRDQLQSTLQAQVDQFQLDLLHANSLTMGRLLGAVSSALTVPTSSHIRDIMSLSKSAIRDLNLHKQLIAVSNATRDYHIAQGIERDQITTCYNGIDTRFFTPKISTGTLKRELNLPAEAILSATIGQICLRKAQTDVARAAVELKDRFPQLHFLFIGERHSEKEETVVFDRSLSELFREAGIEHRFHRLGFRQDVSDILNQVDLLVHAAKQEPLGRVLLEAGACGIPIVATHVGGTTEIFQHNESALLVKPGSPHAIADSVVRVLQNRELAERLGSGARNAIVSRFDIEQSQKHLAMIWKHVLSETTSQ